MRFSLWLGRVLFGGYFFFSGLNHFINMKQLAPYAASKGVPIPELAVAFTGALIVLGGLSVLLGFMPRVGLTLIVLFLIPVTLVMHNFWALQEPERMAQMVHFLKNTGLLGACFAMIALPVPWPGSVWAKRQKEKTTHPPTDWLTGRRLPQ
jgi:uncharacterized membrane protein YphA (DoxX/SURF4 family)